jgi:DNA-binding transcriptional ArsR family regulator
MTTTEDAALARAFRAIAHPRRAGIFRLLLDRPETGQSFQKLQHATGLCDSSLVHHLREMERCGLIRRRRKGVFVTYLLSLADFQKTVAETASLCLAARSGLRQVK